MLQTKIEKLLSFLKDKNILITTHCLVDIDGYVSCHVLKLFLKQHFNKVEVCIYFPELSKSTKEFRDKFIEKFPGIDLFVENKEDVSNFNVILVLDTNNLNLVTFSNKFSILESQIPFIFLDHHYDLTKDYKNNVNSLNLIMDDYTSTTEIIFELCEMYNVSLNPPINYFLMAGILTDSGFFKHGNNNTILRFSKLIDNQLDYKELILMLKLDVDISERIAKIKGLQRVKIIKEGKWLIGISNVGSFGARVANSLINNGFDVAIVSTKKKKHDSRISMRASKKICLETGLHLGKILEKVSVDCNESGGGHDGAASINHNIEQENIIKNILSQVKQFTNKSP